MKFLLVLIITTTLVFGGCRLVNAEPYEQGFILRWTAPADNGPTGKGSQYDLRYSDDADKLINDFNNQPQIPDMPIPSMAGATDSVICYITVSAGDSVFFSIKTADDIPFWSAASIPIGVYVPDTQPPFVIIDLSGGLL